MDTRIIKEMREAVFGIFDRHEFKDGEGNDLRHCQDFIDLVELAIRKEG